MSARGKGINYSEMGIAWISVPFDSGCSFVRARLRGAKGRRRGPEGGHGLEKAIGAPWLGQSPGAAETVCTCVHVCVCSCVCACSPAWAAIARYRG